jgi:membrane associated rhomboid family serine protease
MFPLRDDNPTERTPWVTGALIVSCAAVWFLVQGGGLAMDRLATSVCTWGAIPAEILGEGGLEGGPCDVGGPIWSTLLTSIFLHGGWAHLIGNLWFLWIFGNNVEDELGHLRFVAFYVLCGLAATAAHVASAPSSPLPMVGASGAISGVMGAYLLFHPRARIRTLLVVVVFFTVVDVPAFVYLGYWFLLQLASAQVDLASTGGVAFWAHIGGFVAGAGLAPLLRRPRIRRRGQGRFTRGG